MEDVSRAAWPGRFGVLASLALAVCLAAPALQAQIVVTAEKTTGPGPGTVESNIGVCNRTALPFQVQGYRFRTPDFAGYAPSSRDQTTMGTAPVEYTKPIPENEQQMVSGQCRIADYWTGSVPAGQNATLSDFQALVKTGSCSEAPRYIDSDPLTCASPAFEAARADARYSDNRCLIDTLGANAGDTLGGFVSTFHGQTQIQAVLPNNAFVVSMTDVKWNPYAYGPQYMMALAGAQEIFNVDMQLLAAMAAKESFMGLVRAENGALLHNNTTQEGVYGYWQVENSTFNTWVKAYPQFFPTYGPCISNYPDVTAAFPACAPAIDAPPIHYLRPNATTQMGPNSPQLINGAVSTSLGLYNIYDILIQSTDLCFTDIIRTAQDKRIALAAMLPAYNLGRNSPFADGFLVPGIRDMPNASSQFPEGNSGYRTNIYGVLDQLVNASKNCGPDRKVYDTAITIEEFQRFLFGGSTTPGTAAAQADGGLLQHYALTPDQRLAMWDDVKCAFDRLKGKAPSTQGNPARAQAISYRYDFLTLLRVVKKHLPGHIRDRRTPVEYDFLTAVKRYSAKGTVCGATPRAIDKTYPSLSLVSPRPGESVDQIKTPGLTFTFKGTDVGGKVAKAQWTFDKNLTLWQAARAAGTDTYAFDVSCETPGWPKAGQPGKLWVGLTDDCGNTTVQELAFTVKPGTYCGDAPPLDPPVATPAGGGFFDSVMVTLETPGVTGTTIHYTLDGSKPSAASPVYSGPVKISGAANVTLRAFATKAGMTPSPDASWLFTKETRPLTRTPVADPPGRTFTDLDPAFTVTLTSESGAVIHYSTDGTQPTPASPIYSAPIRVEGTMTIQAIAIAPEKAPSQVMKAVYNEVKAPNPAVKGTLLDEDGNGVIEKAVVVFTRPLAAKPASLAFTVVGEDGTPHRRTAAAEITVDPSDATRAVVRFAQPFPFGVTSLQPGSEGRTVADEAVPTADAAFPLEEQAAPVIVKAEVREDEAGNVKKSIVITYSEPVDAPAASQTAWIFKKGSAEIASAEVVIVSAVRDGDLRVTLAIDTVSTTFPARGDSVAIATAGEIKDKHGRAPAVKAFRVLEGDAPRSKPVKLSILFPNGTSDKPVAGVPAARNPAVFIPLGQDGNPLQGSADQGRCPTCVARDANGYVGPVLHITTPGPLTYEFKIFNNVGEFVATGKGRVSEEELKDLKKDRTGSNWEIPVVWSGLASDKLGSAILGRKAGTGAYIVMATFLLEKDVRTGAGPAKHTDKKTFGLIRSAQ